MLYDRKSGSGFGRIAKSLYRFGGIGGVGIGWMDGLALDGRMDEDGLK